MARFVRDGVTIATFVNPAFLDTTRDGQVFHTRGVSTCEFLCPACGEEHSVDIKSTGDGAYEGMLQGGDPCEAVPKDLEEFMVDFLEIIKIAPKVDEGGLVFAGEIDGMVIRLQDGSPWIEVRNGLYWWPLHQVRSPEKEVIAALRRRLHSTKRMRDYLATQNAEQAEAMEALKIEPLYLCTHCGIEGQEDDERRISAAMGAAQLRSLLHDPSLSEDNRAWLLECAETLDQLTAKPAASEEIEDGESVKLHIFGVDDGEEIPEPEPVIKSAAREIVFQCPICLQYHQAIGHEISGSMTWEAPESCPDFRATMADMDDFVGSFLSDEEEILAEDCSASLNVDHDTASRYVRDHRGSPTFHLEKMRLRRQLITLEDAFSETMMGKSLGRVCRWISKRMA